MSRSGAFRKTFPRSYCSSISRHVPQETSTASISEEPMLSAMRWKTTRFSKLFSEARSFSALARNGYPQQVNSGGRNARTPEWWSRASAARLISG